VKIFLSWSGPASKAVANVLREWLPSVLQSLEPWMSAEDIRKGDLWDKEIASNLLEVKIGVICLTAENLSAPWILFESGVLSRSVERTHVCTFLFGIKPSDIPRDSPLLRFQATILEKSDVQRLLGTINSAQGEHKISEDLLERSFEKWWPELEDRLLHLPTQETPLERQRSDRELLEEVLEIVRDIKFQQSDTDDSNRVFSRDFFSTPVNLHPPANPFSTPVDAPRRIRKLSDLARTVSDTKGRADR